ncbi:MAG: hypothetical protein HUU54_02610 [Ignavibacteriaceae bacterium]|nr:hypothetical protein [Ignavibacteriaceae bacterium]
MPDSNQIQIQFSIADIQTLEFVIFNLPDIASLDKTKFPFKIEAGFFFEVENKIVGIDIIVDISADSAPNPIVCHMITRFKFLINNFNEAFTIKEGNITYPSQFLITLISISLSTTRGILLSKTESTNLRGIFMPIIDPSKLIMVTATDPNKAAE